MIRALTLAAALLTATQAAPEEPAAFWMVELYQNPPRAVVVRTFALAEDCAEATLTHKLSPGAFFATCAATDEDKEQGLTEAMADFLGIFPNED